ARLAAREAERDDRRGGREERLRLADDQPRQRPGDPGGDRRLEDREPGPGEQLDAHPRRAAHALLEGPVAGRHGPRVSPRQASGRVGWRSHLGDPGSAPGCLVRRVGRRFGVKAHTRSVQLHLKGVNDAAEAEAPAPLAAMIVALVALVAALGGTAYAAGRI